MKNPNDYCDGVMMTEFLPGDYIEGIWFADRAGYGNLLITLLKRKTKDWYISVRYRLYLDNKIHGSSDDKSFMSIKPGPNVPLADVMLTCWDLHNEFVKDVQSEQHEYCPVGGDAEKLVEVLKTRDWAHMEVVKTDTEEGRKRAKELGLPTKEEDGNGESSCS